MIFLNKFFVLFDFNFEGISYKHNQPIKRLERPPKLPIWVWKVTPKKVFFSSKSFFWNFASYLYSMSHTVCVIFSGEIKFVLTWPLARPPEKVTHTVHVEQKIKSLRRFEIRNFKTKKLYMFLFSDCLRFHIKWFFFLKNLFFYCIIFDLRLLQCSLNVS